MGYLGVNIHENVVVKGAEFNDKGTFVLGLSTKVDTGDMFASFDEGAPMEADENSLMLFPFNLTDWQGKPKTAAQIGTDINELKNKFVDILKTQMTEAEAKAKLGANIMFAGLGVTPGDPALATKLVNEQFLAGVYKNICNAFIASMTPFFNANPFRIKLVRTSKAKHFAKLPNIGKYKEVWIESMQIPAEASKIKWSDYEIKNGLNSGTPVETDETSTEEAEKVENMFGGGETAGTPVDTAGAAPEVNPFAPQA